MGDDEVTVARLSTLGLTAAERYAFWEDTFSSAHHPVRLTPVGARGTPNDFRADFLRVDATTAKVSIGAMDAVRAESFSSDPDDSTEGMVLLSYQDGGRQVVDSRQGRHTFEGPSLLLQSDVEPSVHLHHSRARTVLISVRADRLTLPWDTLRSAMFLPLPVDDAVRSLILSAADTARRASASMDRVGMSAYLTGVVELVLRSVIHRPDEHLGTVAARRAQAQQVLLDRLGDPHLTAAAVAETLGVSPRRLHQVFAGGPTVAEQIRVARMERAMALLRDPLWKDQPVARIAERCGYLDHSQFSRSFRRQYGTSPSGARD